MVGMRVTLGMDSNEQDAIAKFKHLASEQGFVWLEGTERASFVEYVRGNPIHKLVATKIEETFFKSTVKEYQHIEERPLTGMTWVVLADELPEPRPLSNLEVGYIGDEVVV